MRNILIIGQGYVGKAMKRFFENHYNVTAYDVKDNAPFPEYNFDLAVVCVPTPMLPDGRCDISFVSDSIKTANAEMIIIKSTVPPGTTDHLSSGLGKNIVFSPEFCGESSYWTPYGFHKEIIETPWFIFGGKRELCSKAIDYFMSVAGPTKDYRITDARTAELVKYWENTFYAMKVTFCNEMFDVCKSIGVDLSLIHI